MAWAICSIRLRPFGIRLSEPFGPATASEPDSYESRLHRRSAAAVTWPRGQAPFTDFAKETAIEKEEPIQLEGTVSEVLGNANFRVQVTEEHSVLAKIAGKMRRHRIRVLPGDRVKVEVTPYDLERGRIVYRYRN